MTFSGLVSALHAIPVVRCSLRMRVHGVTYAAQKGQVALNAIRDELEVSDESSQSEEQRAHALHCISELWKSEGNLGKVLRKYARQVNNVLAMASVTTASEFSPRDGSYKPNVIICGKVYTHIGSLINTSNNSRRKFAHLWFHDAKYDNEQVALST